jgi:hypothetical protein
MITEPLTNTGKRASRAAPLGDKKGMGPAQLNWIANLIWGIADDV